MLKGISKHGNPRFVLDLREKDFTVLPLSVKLVVRFSYMPFSLWREIPPTYHLRVCMIKLFNLVICFFCIYWHNYMIFILCYDGMLDHIYLFAYVETRLHSRGKSHLTMVYDPLTCCWTLFTRTLLRTFLSIKIWVCSVFIWLWNENNPGLVKWRWEYTLLFIFLEDFEKDYH